MKSKKWIFILCALPVLIILIYACQSDIPEAVFQLNGKDCRIVTEGARLSQYPEPYCSLKKGETIKANTKAEIRNDFEERPFYKIWLRNEQETDCAYADAKIFKFFMLGGKPGDMVYSGITFGQTEEETDALTLTEKSQITKKCYAGSFPDSDYEAILRTLLFKELGEDWKDQIKWVRYESPAGDKNYYRLEVVFVEGKVYAMELYAVSKVRL